MIDIGKIKEYTGADEAFIAELFGKFLSHLDDDLAELESAAQRGSLPDVRKKAHAMLSSARIFHLADIIRLTERIERDCEAGNSQRTVEDVRELTGLYREAEAEMFDWVRGR